MEIMKLNVYDQIHLLESLDLDNLTSFAETNLHFSLLAADVFRRKHSMKVVKIINPFMVGYGNIVDYGHTIYIQQFGTILRVLKYFGRSISHLVIEYNDENDLIMDNSSINVLSKFINTYCSSSLIHLQIRNYHATFFDEMTMPFKGVKHLSLHGRFKQLASSTLTFSKLFPALQNLSLKYMHIKNTNCIDQGFSSLTHLYVDIWHLHIPKHFNENDVERLLRKNQQIKSLKLSHSSRNFLKIVNEILPNLESLELDIYNPRRSNNDDEPIVFEHVKNFTISRSDVSAPSNIFFPKLEEFHTDISETKDDNWIDIVKENSHLIKLHVENGFVSDQQLKKLSVVSSNLTEVYFNLGTYVKYVTVCSFVKNNKDLKRLHLCRSEVANLDSWLQSCAQI